MPHRRVVGADVALASAVERNVYALLALTLDSTAYSLSEQSHGDNQKLGLSTLLQSAGFYLPALPEAVLDQDLRTIPSTLPFTSQDVSRILLGNSAFRRYTLDLQSAVAGWGAVPLLTSALGPPEARDGVVPAQLAAHVRDQLGAPWLSEKTIDDIARQTPPSASPQGTDDSSIARDRVALQRTFTQLDLPELWRSNILNAFTLTRRLADLDPTAPAHESKKHNQAPSGCQQRCTGLFTLARQSEKLLLKTTVQVQKARSAKYGMVPVRSLQSILHY